MRCQFLQEGTPLRPIVSSMNTPTTGISKFLDRLIRPLFDQHVRATTIIDGVDLIRRLDTYGQNHFVSDVTRKIQIHESLHGELT